MILRNILEGSQTFNEIAAGAPGLSRTLLTRRLGELARVGLITKRPKPGGPGYLYHPTPAGQATERCARRHRLVGGKLGRGPA